MEVFVKEAEVIFITFRSTCTSFFLHAGAFPKEWIPSPRISGLRTLGRCWTWPFARWMQRKSRATWTSWESPIWPLASRSRLLSPHARLIIWQLLIAGGSFLKATSHGVWWVITCERNCLVSMSGLPKLHRNPSQPFTMVQFRIGKIHRLLQPHQEAKTVETQRGGHFQVGSFARDHSINSDQLINYPFLKQGISGETPRSSWSQTRAGRRVQ